MLFADHLTLAGVHHHEPKRLGPGSRRQHLLAATAGAAGSTPSSASSETLAAEISALLQETAALWNAQDTAGLRSLWDTDDPEPFYLAGEQDNWFAGWAAINDYLAPVGKPQITEALRVKFYDLKVRRLADDLAFAAYWMRTDMKLVFAPKAFSSDNRVSAVLRRKPVGWRYTCYAEAFQAPTMYMQKLIEKDVAPDYKQFYEKTTGKPYKG